MPVYYLLLLTFFVALLLKPLLNLPWLDGYLFNNTMALWTYPLFVQNFAQSLDGGDGGARWVASTWSLAIEEQFYLLLPPLIYLMNHRYLTILAVACIAVAPLVRGYLWQVSGHWAAGYFLLPGRMDPLMFGLLAALTLRTARHAATPPQIARRSLGCIGCRLEQQCPVEDRRRRVCPLHVPPGRQWAAAWGVVRRRSPHHRRAAFPGGACGHGDLGRAGVEFDNLL